MFALFSVRNLMSFFVYKTSFFLWLLLSFSVCHMFWTVSLWCSLWWCFFLLLVIWGSLSFWDLWIYQRRQSWSLETLLPFFQTCSRSLPPLWTSVRPFKILSQFIYAFWSCFLFAFFFFFGHEVCRILVSQPGIKPSPPALKTLSLNHWTAREVPLYFLLDSFVCCLFIFKSSFYYYSFQFIFQNGSKINELLKTWVKDHCCHLQMDPS